MISRALRGCGLPSEVAAGPSAELPCRLEYSQLLTYFGHFAAEFAGDPVNLVSQFAVVRAKLVDFAPQSVHGAEFSRCRRWRRPRRRDG